MHGFFFVGWLSMASAKVRIRTLQDPKSVFFSLSSSEPQTPKPTNGAHAQRRTGRGTERNCRPANVIFYARSTHQQADGPTCSKCHLPAGQNRDGERAGTRTGAHKRPHAAKRAVKAAPTVVARLSGCGARRRAKRARPTKVGREERHRSKAHGEARKYRATQRSMGGNKSAARHVRASERGAKR